MDKDEEKAFSVWIGPNDRIVSFEKVEDYEEVVFLNNEEKIQFVVQKGFDGFRIQ